MRYLEGATYAKQQEFRRVGVNNTDATSVSPDRARGVVSVRLNETRRVFGRAFLGGESPGNRSTRNPLKRAIFRPR